MQHWDFPRGTASTLLMVEYGEQRGAPATALLADSGLRRDELRDPHRQLAARQELAVVGNLLAAFPGEPDLGLSVGARYRVATFGIFGYACITSPTLQSAIELALRYYELSYGFCLPSVDLTEGAVELTLEDPGLPPAVSRFLLERDLTSIHGWLADLAGDVPLHSLGFSFAASQGFDYADVLGIQPAFDQPRTTASFSASVLDRPLPQANAVSVAAAEEACRHLLTERRRRGGTAHDVRERLVSIGGRPPPIAEVAEALSVSERTLRRKLADEGTSYRALLDEVRLTLAERLLGTGALSVEDVALRLGYAEATSFIAAFRRWTGQTPARWQRYR